MNIRQKLEYLRQRIEHIESTIGARNDRTLVLYSESSFELDDTIDESPCDRERENIGFKLA